MEIEQISRDRLESIVEDVKGVSMVDVEIPTIKIFDGAPIRALSRLDAEGVIYAETATRGYYRFYRVQNVE